jgi:hypothetical protein
MMRFARLTPRATVFLFAALMTAVPALAGPPLLCFPFDIGQAKSLPIVHRGFGEVDPAYDMSRLVGDTVELLGPKTPVIVRMETLRRATLYARANPKVGADLLAKLQERAGISRAEAPLAVFDFGYLVETYRQSEVRLATDVDGYALVQKANAFQNDPQIEFAAAIISLWPKRADHDAHVKNAEAAANTDPLIAANLAAHLAGHVPATQKEK